MKPVCYVLAALLTVITTMPVVHAQATATVATSGSLRTASFRTADGTVIVFMPSDAAPGDTISGAIVAEPLGASQAERAQRLSALNRLAVEWPDSSAPVSSGRYTWRIPSGVRTGVVRATLRSREGQRLSVAALSIDAVPAPPAAQAPGSNAFELPGNVQAGQPAVVRGPNAGTFGSIVVRVGGADASLLAASPRRLVFRTPATQEGELPLRLSTSDGMIDGVVRVVTVRLTFQFPRGQQAAMMATVGGLQNLAAPLTMTLRNLSPSVARFEGGDSQAIGISPREVGPDGRVVLTRRLTGVRVGSFSAALTVAPPPLSQFDVPRAAERSLSTWEGATGIRIDPSARALIQQSVLETRSALDQFLAQQQAHGGDARDVFGALVSQYCFDLRDAQPPAVAGAVAQGRTTGVRRVVFDQVPNRNANVEIDAADVRRLSFSESLGRIVQRFSGSQPVGYLFIRSVPASAGITIDGQRKNEMTNRRFVTSVGDHAIVISGASRTCRERVRVSAFEITVVACEP